MAYTEPDENEERQQGRYHSGFMPLDMIRVKETISQLFDILDLLVVRIGLLGLAVIGIWAMWHH